MTTTETVMVGTETFTARTARSGSGAIATRRAPTVRIRVDYTAYTGGTYTCTGDTQGFYENGVYMGPLPGCYYDECSGSYSYSYSYSYSENDCTATCPYAPTTCDEFYSAAGLCDDCADAFMGCATSCPYEFLSYYASQRGCTYDFSMSYAYTGFSMSYSPSSFFRASYSYSFDYTPTPPTAVSDDGNWESEWKHFLESGRDFSYSYQLRGLGWRQ